MNGTEPRLASAFLESSSSSVSPLPPQGPPASPAPAPRGRWLAPGAWFGVFLCYTRIPNPPRTLGARVGSLGPIRVRPWASPGVRVKLERRGWPCALGGLGGRPSLPLPPHWFSRVLETRP